MSNGFLAAAASTSAERASFSWLSPTTFTIKILRALFRTVGTWHHRRRQHRELFEFLASDHRAAADIGITRYDAEHWFDWPFRS
jgi:uncharacterized protein YjiS (DUF1127 family)